MRGKETPQILKLLVLIIPITLVLAVSGCTGPTTGATGPGVVVLNWEPDFTDVESRDDVQLRLRVQNQGGEQANNVRALLTLLTFGGDEWLLLYGTEEELLKPYLLPPNPRYGTQGEVAEYIWKLSAPLLPEGIPPKQYTPGVRVFYDYVTTAIKPITLVNENQLRQLIDSGGTLPTQASQHSAGPLSVNVVTGRQIKVVEERIKTFPITIHIENTGGGIPYWAGQGSMLYGIPEEHEYDILLAIQLPPQLGFVTCGEYAGTGSGQGSYVQLWKGRTADLTCELEILTIPAVAQEGSIKLYLDYGYAIDRQSSITVKGLYGG